MKSTLLVILSSVILIVNSIYARTEVEGEVSGEWTVEGSPYIIVAPAVILEDDTLLIHGGVTVEFTEEGPLELNGTLIAQGTENDSIFFRGFDQYGYIDNPLEHPSDAQFYAEYVSSILQYPIRGSYSLFTLQHSSIRSIQLDAIGPVVVTDNDFQLEFPFGELYESEINGVTEGLIWERNIVANHGIVFRRISAGYIGDNIGHPIYNDYFGLQFYPLINFESCNEIEIVDNSGYDLRIRSCRFDVHDNDLNNISLSGFYNQEPNGILNNNNIADHCEVTAVFNIAIVNNDIRGALIMESNNELTINNNIVRGQYGRGQNWNSINIRMFNNTFLDHRYDRGTDYHPYQGFENALLINNVFVGSNYGGRLFDRAYQHDESDYNCYFGFDSIFADGSEPSEHDVIADPSFVGGNPFDVGLRFDSPCIDSGDPDMEDDPDGSLPDIGARFFDQRIDHPPVITSKWWDYAGQNYSFNYEATAIDDSDELNLSFENLPVWLRVVRRDPAQGSIQLGGEVPADQDDFIFFITATDDQDNEDTVSVSIDCLPGMITRGELSGSLTADYSPYCIVDDIWVDSGSALIIEPSVELLIFPKSRHYYGNNSSIHMDFRGKLSIFGSEDYPVHIYKDSSWNGVNERLYGSGNYHPGVKTLNFNSNDSCIIRQTVIDLPSIKIDRSAYCEIVGSMFESINIDETPMALLRDNEAVALSVYADVSEIEGNYFHPFEYDRHNQPSGGGLRVRGEYTNVANNIIKGFNSISWWNQETYFYSVFLTADTVLFRHNLLVNNGNGLAAGNHRGEDCYMEISSNTIMNSFANAMSVDSDGSGIIMNNLIRDSEVGIHTGLPFENEIEIRNNLIDVGNGMAIRYPPEDIGIINQVNENGDSTDVFGNIYQNAQVINFGYREGAVQRSSSAIDAASDDLPDDPDGSPPDIGFYDYDHDLSPPEITYVDPYDDEMGDEPWETTTVVFGAVDHQLVFFVGAEDEDSDSLSYRWLSHHLLISEGTMYRDDYREAIEQRVQFVNDGIYELLFQITDGNDLITVRWELRIGNVEVEKERVVPFEFAVLPAFPNPFNHHTTIQFTLPNRSDVSVEIFDVRGRKVSRQIYPEYNAGHHTISIDGQRWASGTYFLHFSAGNFKETKRIILIR